MRSLSDTKASTVNTESYGNTVTLRKDDVLGLTLIVTAVRQVETQQFGTRMAMECMVEEYDDGVVYTGWFSELSPAFHQLAALIGDDEAIPFSCSLVQVGRSHKLVDPGEGPQAGQTAAPASAPTAIPSRGGAAPATSNGARSLDARENPRLRNLAQRGN